MQYVVVERVSRGVYRHDPSRYVAELANLRADLPVGAWAFAAEPGHYDFAAPNCVKDLRLRALPSVAPLPRSLALRFDRGPVSGANGLTICYRGVTDLEIRTEDGAVFDLSDYHSLRLDEILPAPAGCTHEMAFTTATIRIVCADLEAQWDPSSD